MTEKRAIVLSALWCCGKTSLYKSCKKYSIIDLDEILEPPKDTLVFNKECMDIDWYFHITKNISLYDFIFLSIKRCIFDVLQYYKIPYVLVFPENTEASKLEWERRNKKRNTEWLWNVNRYTWDSILENLKYDPYAERKYELKENQYLSDVIDQIYQDHLIKLIN